VPVGCAIGTACFVQNYVDQAPGPEARDHTCGPLTYDKHQGTDFRVPGLREMAAGVPVLAAAPGVVRRVRDGMPDVSIREAGANTSLGAEAGNAVVIDHGAGWETQYSHLRKGSIAVRVGQRVAAGARLGLIGLSGMTEFPHLHFAVRRNGRTIDPYTGGPPERGCGLPAAPLWSAAAQVFLAYRSGGLLLAGFAGAPVTLNDVLGAEAPTAATADAQMLIFWAAAWGLRAGDREEMRLIGPGGEVVAEQSNTLDADKAQWLRYVGRRRGAVGLPAGTYRGEYRVTRDADGQTVTVVATARRMALR
jgi:hypothetical protein